MIFVSSVDWSLNQGDICFLNFFFSSEGWSRLLQLCAIRRLVGDWDAEFMWVLHTPKGRRSLTKVFITMAWHGAIHFLRRQRMAKFHNGGVPWAEKVFKVILSVIRLKVAGSLEEKEAALARAGKNSGASWGHIDTWNWLGEWFVSTLSVSLRHNALVVLVFLVRTLVVLV